MTDGTLIGIVLQALQLPVLAWVAISMFELNSRLSKIEGRLEQEDKGK